MRWTTSSTMRSRARSLSSGKGVPTGPRWRLTCTRPTITWSSRLPLPGIKADEVQISVTGDVLTIKGETTQEEENKDKAWHIREQRWGAFERSVALPTAVTSDKANAEFENGILIITLPKAEEVKPKAITVKTK